MWINNYDDPEEMDIETALHLLRVNGFQNVTEEANRQNHADIAYVFTHPSGEGVYYCEDDEEVIELVIGVGLEETPEGIA
jgi:hypothetical protein